MAGRGRGMVLPAWMSRGDAPAPGTAGAGAAASTSTAPAASAAAAATPPAANGDARRHEDARGRGPAARPTSSYRDRDRGHGGGYGGGYGGGGHRGGGRPGRGDNGVPPGPAGPRVAMDGWAEHRAEDGTVYYFNQMTGESTYDKPVSLMTHVERKLPRTEWKAYAQEGKLYFHHAKSNETTWEEPMEFTMYKERLRALCNGDVPTKDMDSLAVFNAAKRALEECNAGLADDDGLAEEERRKELTVHKVLAAADRADYTVLPSDLVVPAEAGQFPGAVAGKLPADAKDPQALRTAFQELLNERNVPPSSNWKEALTYGIANDVRFHALRGSGARQEALADYAKWKAEENQRLRKERLQTLRDDLRRHLAALAETGSIDGHSSSRSVLERLRSEHGAEMDAWDRADWGLRDDDIKDFLDDLYEKEKRQHELRRDAELEALDAALKTLFARGQVPLDGTAAWDDLKPAVLAVLAEEKADEEAPEAMEVEGAAPAEEARIKVRAFSELAEKELADSLVDFILSVRKERKKELARAVEDLKEDAQIKSSLEAFRAWFQQTMLARLAPAQDQVEAAEGKGADQGLPESFKALRKSDARFVEAMTSLESFKVIKEAAKALPPGPDGAADSSEALDDLACTVVGEDAKQVLEELHDQLEDAYKIIKKDLKSNRVRVLPSLPWDNDSSRYVSSLPELVEKLGEDARRQIEEGFSERIHLAAFQRLRADADKKVRRRMEDFKVMLGDILCRSKHVGMPYSEALSRIKREPEYEELDSEALRTDVFREYMQEFEASMAEKKKRKHDRDDDRRDSRDPSRSRSRSRDDKRRRTH